MLTVEGRISKEELWGKKPQYEGNQHSAPG